MNRPIDECDYPPADFGTGVEPADTRGPAVAILGSLNSGIREIYGPFATVDEAAKWALPRSYAFGQCTIQLLTPAGQCKIHAYTAGEESSIA